MTLNQNRHSRRSIRLRGYDYSQQGAYFVTICTHDSTSVFDNAANRSVAEQCWLAIPDHFPTIELDVWVVMPNHVHGILIVANQGRGVQLNAPTVQKLAVRNPGSVFSEISPRRGTLSVVVRTYKAAVTTHCRRAGNIGFAWQRNYHEHVIRTDDELNRLRQHVLDNHVQWEQDEYNPTEQGEPLCPPRSAK